MVARTGLEVLIREHRELVRGRRIGLVTHAAAVRSDMVHALDALIALEVGIGALFGPEHGLDGAVADGAAIADARHPRTGMPIYSLYGEEKAPSAAVLQDIDALVFDMQDVGVRFYTFISTLYYVLKSAAETGTPVIVLDRPNPIGGVTVEGPILDPAYTSFVGIAPIPIRYGLTMGELAQYINNEMGLSADLTVIPMQGWRRDMWFEDTGLHWVPTSPAMPHPSTTVCYPGTCLLEGTNLSEGRGTALPFEICGAPWIDGHALAAHLNARGLEGVIFRPARFVPGSPSRYEGAYCGGVQIHVMDRERFRPVSVGLHLIAAVRTLCPDEFAWRAQSWEGGHPHFDLLTGSAHVRRALESGVDVDALVEGWADDLMEWQEIRRPYLFYS
ncbi:MAG: exo-beta-N-acetylmuramidase NamZ family protein [Anaerolineae bacterium]